MITKLENLKDYPELFLEKIIEYTPKVIVAILILVIGWWVANLLVNLLKKYFKKKDFDPSLELFLISLTKWALRILLIVTVISQLGVQTSSFVAMIGGATLAVGLALQGSLANFAGGVLILIFKPFKVGDFIAAQSQEGTVQIISIINTQLLTNGNQRVIIPNGKLFNEVVKNYSSEPTRKEFLDFGISYDANIVEAKEILNNLVSEQENILKEPAPQIVVSQLGDSSVNISVRYWTTIENYWLVRFYTLEEGKKRLEAADISIPFPQRDVHIYNKN